ncbi:hypothetical protein KIN20_022402 [Parelaphostrongylus tenuis]|uniref:Uncharacterized protein n=1 Tax=Parelaphostrongylus tenuis TaxID=148309 RepID=A0AAD5QV56_PARTN|nr:hypothetical protein KIN20_022402 [Parelaphostrongylus tenuis]
MRYMPHYRNGSRSTATNGHGESGGGVRRRAKSPTSMPSSYENTSPQKNSYGDASGREQKAQDGEEDSITDNSRNAQQSSEGSPKQYRKLENLS